MCQKSLLWYSNQTDYGDWQCSIFVQHQAPLHKQTTSTCSASVNKDRLFVRLCEGVWLATIMALAAACVITLTRGCFVCAVISAGLNLDRRQNVVSNYSSQPTCGAAHLTKKK